MVARGKLAPKYGKLTPVERVRQTRYGWVWRCDCECGGTTEALAAKLRAGRKTSCGCSKQDRAKQLKRFGSEHRAWTGHGRISGSLWCRIVKSAENRDIPFLLTIEQAWDLFEAQGGRCAISGVELHLAGTSRELAGGLNTASLDRIDSEKGYELGNVQWVHVDVNYMKQWFPQDKFVEWCRLITQHQERKFS